MKKFLYIFASLLVAAVCAGNTGCGGGGKGGHTESAALYDEGISYDRAPAETGITTDTAIPSPEEDRKKIIKTGRMSLDVADIGAAKAGVDGLVAGNGGYYSSEAFNESDYRTTYDLSIRIPSAGYEKFIAALEGAGYGTVSSKTIDARDVTEEFIDIETRLANKRSYLERYRQLLKKAVTIKEIMEIEEQVRALEEEIESAEGRLRYLGDQVSYSTLDLVLVRQKDYVYTPSKSDRFWERVKRALSGGWSVLKWIVLAFVYIWPLLLITGVVLFLVFYFRKKRRAKKRAE